MLRRLILLFVVMAGLLSATPALAQSNDMPPQVQELLRLLDDPVIRDWVAAQKAGSVTAPVTTKMTPSGYMDQRLSNIRSHIAGLIVALPQLPDEIARARGNLMLELKDRGIVRVILLIIGFLALGGLLEWLFRRATGGIQHWITTVSLDTVGDRLRAAGIRLCFGLGLVIMFAVGSIGAFLAFTWPPLLREIVLGYLTAFLVLRITLVVCRFTLAPGGERFRLVPMNTVAAWFWYRRIGLAIGWLAMGWVTVGLLGVLGLSPSSRVLVAYVLGLILLAIGIEAVWRRPPAPIQPSELSSQQHRRLTNWLLTAYFAILWLLWVVSAMPAFWLAVAMAALPASIKGIQRAVNHVLRPAGAVTALSGKPSVTEVCLERGLRALLIIGAALLLARAWHIDLVAMTMQDNLSTRLMRGLLSAIVIALVAEFLWHFVRAVIDAKVTVSVQDTHIDNEETRRQARLRTLLPILRNVLFVIILVIAILMILSSMGIEIAPLIAGAGVVGVAVGFGAQTLVKDVISGMFFLLDDAFRIGEYIQSGSYKGTVESFSLRSVKLRHHRGPLYTVPFGELGAVQNMSRDWVIDKMMIGVTYDTDLEKARKLIKEVGKELAANPEFAPHILEPLKMQGVEQFGDYAIQIRMKMMTKPGEQFVIRRKALALIRKTFNEHGINFAQPTVQVAGGGEHAASAAAKQMLDHAAPGPVET